MEKRLADKINCLSKKDRNEIEKLNNKVIDYTDKLKSSGIKDQNIARKLDQGFLRYFAVIAGFPIFVAGFLSNLLPFVLPGILCNTFIKDLRFYSSVYITTGTVLYLIYFPLVLILAGILWGWIGLLYAFLVPFLGYAVLYYQEIARERFNTLRFSIKSVLNPHLIDDLKIRRREIKAFLEDISTD